MSPRPYLKGIFKDWTNEEVEALSYAEIKSAIPMPVGTAKTFDKLQRWAKMEMEYRNESE